MFSYFYSCFSSLLLVQVSSFERCQVQFLFFGFLFLRPKTFVWLSHFVCFAWKDVRFFLLHFTPFLSHKRFRVAFLFVRTLHPPLRSLLKSLSFLPFEVFVFFFEACSSKPLKPFFLHLPFETFEAPFIFTLRSLQSLRSRRSLRSLPLFSASPPLPSFDPLEGFEDFEAPFTKESFGCVICLDFLRFVIVPDQKK